MNKYHSIISSLRDELKDEFHFNILPYWKTYALDEINGGFVGRVSSTNQKIYEADKGIILNARLLWTFSAGFRCFENEDLKTLALRSFTELRDRFWDSGKGGFYWLIASDAKVLDDKKHLYAQAFGMYALSEAYAVFGWKEAKEMAIELFDLVHKNALDTTNGGYYEACDRFWNPQNDIQLSTKDIPAVKTMNTHLHLMEAFTNLYKFVPLQRVKKSLEATIDLFLNHIINTDHYLNNYMDAEWSPISDSISYGHNIEASWLLLEAAEVVGNPTLIEKVREAALLLADHVLKNGLDPLHGGIFNEGTTLNFEADTHKDWWPQAEAVIGFINAFELTKKQEYLVAAIDTWAFIKQYLIDHSNGEWFECVTRSGKAFEEMDKIRMWKAPYHNSRMVFEGILRCDKLLEERFVEALNLSDEHAFIPNR